MTMSQKCAEFQNVSMACRLVWLATADNALQHWRVEFRCHVNGSSHPSQVFVIGKEVN